MNSSSHSEVNHVCVEPGVGFGRKFVVKMFVFRWMYDRGTTRCQKVAN